MLRVVAFSAALAVVSTLATAGPISGVIYDPIPGTGAYTLLPNGGFETGDTTSWPTVAQWQGEFDVVDTMSFLGTYSARSNTFVDFSGAGYALGTGVAVMPGETYVLSGFLNKGSLTTGGGLYLDLNDASFEVNAGSPTLLLQQDWFFVWGEFTVPDTVSMAVVRLVRDGSDGVKAGEYGYVDEVAVTLASDFSLPDVYVPEPSTGVLVALGAFGLLIHRRRRRG